MPTLVVGGTGFIGPRLIRRLVARGESVVCMDLSPGTASFAELGDRVTVIRGDVTRFDDVLKAVIEVKPERLINLAYG
ncbi:MAG: NAD-dependent epimerase/dehydratase family protein, partial [Gammaproteobacteria bacterium]